MQFFQGKELFTVPNINKISFTGLLEICSSSQSQYGESGQVLSYGCIDILGKKDIQTLADFTSKSNRAEEVRLLGTVSFRSNHMKQNC